jgi:hypothetical protein
MVYVVNNEKVLTVRIARDCWQRLPPLTTQQWGNIYPDGQIRITTERYLNEKPERKWHK